MRITRLKFCLYLLILLVIFFLMYNLDVIPFASLMFILSVISAGAVPFLFGFILQWLFCRRDIPSYVSWLISVLIITVLLFVQGVSSFNLLDNVAGIPIFIILSIVVAAGFMDSGIRTFQKLRNKMQHKKAARPDSI